MFSMSRNNSEIEFPVDCRLRIIMKEQDEAKARVIRSLKLAGFSGVLEKGNASKSGKYVTWYTNVRYEDQESMRSTMQMLEAIDGVKMVL